jgi:hypothetical protein
MRKITVEKKYRNTFLNVKNTLITGERILGYWEH